MLTENPTTDKTLTVSEIKQCIKALKSNKRRGTDLISNEILKYSSVEYKFLEYIDCLNSVVCSKTKLMFRK
jgi:hypothetical protein